MREKNKLGGKNLAMPGREVRVPPHPGAEGGFLVIWLKGSDKSKVWAGGNRALLDKKKKKRDPPGGESRNPGQTTMGKEE